MHYVDLNEIEFENEFVEYLTAIGGVKQWEYRREIKTTEQLWANFKNILEKNNQSRLDDVLSKAEFAQVKREIEKLDTPFKAGQFLYGTNGVSQVEITMDNGKHVFLTIFDQSQIGGGDTVYQVVNQIERPKVIDGKQDRRFDVTLLINGLPIIQIELKKAMGCADEALNQMKQYIAERQYGNIYSTLQVLVAMTPYDVLYMANSPIAVFNKDFAFFWQTEDGKRVSEWKDFSGRVLSIPMAHELSTRYMILDDTKGKENIKVMRPYQVYATKKALDKAMKYKFNTQENRLGYVWHTTGSGKTITSFKTAWLASRMSHIDNVIFLVDRIALTNQTRDAYRAYDPTATSSQTGIILDTASTRDLSNKLRSKNNRNIIVTSIHKMSQLVKKEKFKDLNQNLLFVVDEAHRSTGDGEEDNEGMLQAIRNAIPSAAWLGYTGTPRFEKSITNKIFGDLLHAYTIKEAIKDRNVLGFNVEFKETIKAPDNPQDDDLDDMIKRSVYDTHEKHVELVVKDILSNWDNRSNNGKYNALFTVHVGQGSSVPRVMQYFDEFIRQMEELPQNKRINIGVSFTPDTTNSKNQLETNQNLHRAIKHYNELFNTNFDMQTVKEYIEDLASRLDKSAEDKKYLDLVIVIDQFLTGFDAVELNTLYIDRMFRGLTLIQAYSRTNRIHKNITKPWGNVVHYRWPEQARIEMERAFEIYANADNALGVPEEEQDDYFSVIFAKSYLELKKELITVIGKLKEQTDGFSDLPPCEIEKLDMQRNLKEYNMLINQIKQHPYDEKTGLGFNNSKKKDFYKDIGMTVEDEVKLVGVLARRLREYVAKKEKVDVSHIELDMSHIQEVRINYGYLRDLIAKIANKVHSNEMEYIEKDKENALIEIGKIENEKLRQELIWFVEEVYYQRYKFPTYPVLGLEKIINDGLSAAKENSNLEKSSSFIEKWGLIEVATPKQLISMFRKHKKGEDDLDNQKEVTNLMNRARVHYTEFAERDVATLSWIAYRSAFRTAIKDLADELVDRM